MRCRASGILSGLLLLASAAFSQAPPPAPLPVRAREQPDPAAEAGGNTYTYARRYQPGEVDRYEVRVRDTERDTDLVGVTEHRVFLRDGVPTEKVRWIRLTESELGDFSDMAHEVPSYEMSLDPRGVLSVVDVKADPVMLEMITDLYAFYFAVSPGAGIANLQRVGDSFVRPELVSDEWADGKQFLVGRSRSGVRLDLASVSPKEVVYQADLRPPVHPALAMERAWMQLPVCGDAPNNLEFVRRQDNGFLAAWGCEKSQITSRVDPATGKLLAAFMSNDMTWNVTGPRATGIGQGPREPQKRPRIRLDSPGHIRDGVCTGRR
jgi:hypothetical protein